VESSRPAAYSSFSNPLRFCRRPSSAHLTAHTEDSAALPCESARLQLQDTEEKQKYNKMVDIIDTEFNLFSPPEKGIIVF
jgi:hypothetical protein